jgi:uncharacterized protein YneF (UPF0154 family)
MAWFSNMTLKGKLLLGFITVAIIAGIIGGTGIFYVKKSMRPIPSSMRR